MPAIVLYHFYWLSYHSDKTRTTIIDNVGIKDRMSPVCKSPQTTALRAKVLLYPPTVASLELTQEVWARNATTLFVQFDDHGVLLLFCHSKWVTLIQIYKDKMWNCSILTWKRNVMFDCHLISHTSHYQYLTSHNSLWLSFNTTFDVVYCWFRTHRLQNASFQQSSFLHTLRQIYFPLFYSLHSPTLAVYVRVCLCVFVCV